MLLLLLLLLSALLVRLSATMNGRTMRRG